MNKALLLAWKRAQWAARSFTGIGCLGGELLEMIDTAIISQQVIRFTFTKLKIIDYASVTPYNKEAILRLPTLYRPKNHMDASSLFLSDLLTCRLYLNNITERPNRPGLFIFLPTNACWNIVEDNAPRFCFSTRAIFLSYDIFMATTMSRTAQELKAHKSHWILQ